MAKKNFVYKVTNSIFRVMQGELSVKQTLAYSGVTDSATNSLAYDNVNSTLFFIKSDLKLYYIQSGDTVATEVSGFTSPTAQPANAAYHNGAIWYFEFNSNVLVKLTLTYSGGVPSVSGKTTYTISSMSLPAEGEVGVNTNTFGDITIDNNNGILYAMTSRGRFYSINLSNPASTFNEITSSPGNDRSVGLQLVYNDSTNVLYGHNHKTGYWYTVNTSTGAKTLLTDLNTSLFRDIAGTTSSSMYGNDSNGDIYEVDITLSSPTTLNQFFTPSGVLVTGPDNLDVNIQTSIPDQKFRIGIFETTSEPSVKIDWGDGTSSTYKAEGYVEHIYEDLISAPVKIQGDLAGGELRIGGKPVPVYTTTWGNTYKSSEMVRSVAPITGIANISSIEFANNINLTGIPESLFTDVTDTITNLNNTFENTALTGIPTGLLVNMTGVTSYVATFRNCTGISQVPIPFFDVHDGITDMSHFLDYTVIDNYDNFLDWLYTQANSVNLNGVTLGACGNETTNSTGSTARTNLVNNLSWTINDETSGCGGVPPTTTPPTTTPPATTPPATTPPPETTPGGSG